MRNQYQRSHWKHHFWPNIDGRFFHVPSLYMTHCQQIPQNSPICQKKIRLSTPNHKLESLGTWQVMLQCDYTNSCSLHQEWNDFAAWSNKIVTNIACLMLDSSFNMISGMCCKCHGKFARWHWFNRKQIITCQKQDDKSACWDGVIELQQTSLHVLQYD